MTSKEDALKQLEELRGAVENTIAGLEGTIAQKDGEVSELKQMLQMETSNHEALRSENENLKQEILSLRGKLEAYEKLQEAVKSIKLELEMLIDKEAVGSFSPKKP